MWKSCKEYLPAMLQRWWVVAIGFIGSITGVLLNILQDLTVPIWVWIGIGILSIFIAQFLAFHKIRKERDELQGQLNIIPTNGVIVIKQPPKLEIAIQGIEFGASGDSGYPLLNADKNKARWVRLSLIFKGNVFLETLGLSISGKEPITANEWKPGHTSPLYYYFQIPDWVKSKEERTIQVRAFANGKLWGSPERSINFP